MASYNKVVLMGNLTRDPELRYTPANQAICKFGIAINRVYTTAQGERREEVDFIDCEMWGRRGEVINQYLRKGNPIFVEGRLRLDRWEDPQGNKKSRLLVVAENFEFIGGGQGAQGGQGGQGGQGNGGSRGGGDEYQGGGDYGHHDGDGYAAPSPAPMNARAGGGGGSAGGGYRSAGPSGGGGGGGGGRPAPAGAPQSPIEEEDIPF